MFKGFYNLTSGMLTHGKNLNVISNNMANVATNGFKADYFTGQTFQDVLWSRVGNKDKEYIDLGQQSFITAPSQLYTDYTQGTFDPTENPLDFAIEGENCYFAVQGADGQRAYTRAGAFTLDNEGYLTLPGFGRVLDDQGREIYLVTDKIRGDDYGGLYMEQGGGFLGRIGVYQFPEDNQPIKAENGLFTGGGNPEVTTTVKVHQGMLERANVNLIQQMVRMISTQRAYQSAAQVTKMYDQVMTKATTDLGRM